MKRLTSSRFVLSALLAGSLLASCSEETTTDPNGDKIQVPQAYTFTSRFESGTSSVNYGGQTVRNLLIQDVSSMISKLGTSSGSAITADQLLALYDYSDASDLTSSTSTGTLPPLEDKYSSISTGKNLSGKISGDVVIGTGKTADQLLREWFNTIAQLSAQGNRIGTPMAYTTDEGVDLSQMVNKLLLGSVAYYQGTGVYLNGIAEKNNADRDGGTAPYTSMEHAWDEAFGYFGAARDFNGFTDAQLAGSTQDYVKDVNGDGKIDFQSEYNYAFARGAGKRDVGSVTGTDFTKSVFDAFLGGRTSIVNQGTTTELVAFRNQAAAEWEKVIAASVIHYINETLTDMSELTSESNASNSPDLNKHWGEMKGYAMALQFNPMKKLSDAELATIQSLLGDHPIYAVPGSLDYQSYLSALVDTRTRLQNAYGFAETDVLGW